MELFDSLSPYSQRGFDALLEYQMVDYHAAARALRRYRQQVAHASGIPMRMRVTLHSSHPATRDEIVDEVTCYGWRAALTAIRAMLRESCRPSGWYVPFVDVRDAYLVDVYEHRETA